MTEEQTETRPTWPSATAALAQRIERALDRLTERVGELDRADELDDRPHAGAWSPREIAEHVALTDHYLLILAEKIASKSARRLAEGQAPPEEPSSTAHLERIAGRPFRWRHPEHMTPTGDVDAAELQRRLARDSVRARELLERMPAGEGSLHRIRMSVVPRADRLDLYQYLTIVALHAERHLEQMASPYFRETARLGFRRWTEHDEALARSLWGDPEVTRLIAREPLDDAEVRARLNAEIEAERDAAVQYWPVFELEGGDFVGCCGLRPRDEPGRVYELGFHILPAYQGRGYATEAARAVVEHAFETLGAAALFAGHHPDNVASRKVLERLGFAYTHDEPYAPTDADHRSYRLERSGGGSGRVGSRGLRT